MFSSYIHVHTHMTLFCLTCIAGIHIHSRLVICVNWEVINDKNDDDKNNKHTHPPDQLIWLYQKNIAGSIFILSLLCTAFASAKMVQSRQVFRSGFMVLSKKVTTWENMSKKTKVFFSAFMAVKEAFIFTCTWIFCVCWQPQLQTWCITTVHVLGDCSCETNKKMNSLFTFCCHYSLSNGEIKFYQGKHII